MPADRPTVRRITARVVALLAVAAVGACLGACTGSPYVDSRREAGKKIMVGSSNADVVAICYKGGDPQPDVIKLAEDACKQTDRVPQYVSHTRLSCNWLTPSRAFFRCVAPETQTETPQG
jgi:hypothetical protein